ncbi:MFS transporter, partial [Achromobacter sp. AGC39]
MQRLSNRWLGVVAIFLIVTISYVDRINLSILITQPDFLKQIGLTSVDKGAQGLLATVFMVGYGLSSIVLTPMCVAVLGVRRSLVYGLCLWGVITVTSPLYHSYSLLLLSRLLLGLSEGPLFALASCYVKATFDGHENGKPNSLINSGTGMGFALGYPFVAMLVLQLDWQASFYVLGLVNLLVGIPVALLFVHMPPGSEPQRGATVSLRDTLVRHLPGMFRGALQTRHVILITVLTSSFLAYMWGVGNWLPGYLKEARGFDLRDTGWLASMPQWSTILAVLAGGWLIDRIKREQVPLIFVGGSLGVVAAVSLALLVDDRYHAIYCLSLAGFCWGLQSPAIPSTMQFYARPEHIGSAFGVVNGVGSMVGGMMPAAMGAAIAMSSADSAPGAAAYSAGFYLLVGSQLITWACGVLLWLRVRDRS